MIHLPDKVNFPSEWLLLHGCMGDLLTLAEALSGVRERESWSPKAELSLNFQGKMPHLYMLVSIAFLGIKKNYILFIKVFFQEILMVNFVPIYILLIVI